jgi:chromosome segregation ATPase
MSMLLEKQIEATEKSATRLQQELRDKHQEIRRKVEEIMQLVVELFADLNKDVERWQASIAQSKLADAHDARSLYDSYARLDQTAGVVAELAQRLEREGSDIAGKANFLLVWRKIKAITCFSLDRVAESVDQLRRGEGRALTEFADELSRDSEP